MNFRERFFGVLVVANPVDNRLFTEMECTLMQSLAEQAALALHNAEFLNLQIERSQLDLDLSIASGIQQMLLPSQSTVFPGLDLDARYAPAQRVGGDLFDIIALSPTRLGVAVADVSGKGIAASLYMAVVQDQPQADRAPPHVPRPGAGRAQPDDGGRHPRGALCDGDLRRDRHRGEHA